MDGIEERLNQLIDEQHGATVMLSQEARNRYIQCRDALRNGIAADWRAMVEALEEVEWEPDDLEGGDYCPWCQNYQDMGHRPDCQRQAALARVRGE